MLNPKAGYRVSKYKLYCNILSMKNHGIDLKNPLSNKISLYRVLSHFFKKILEKENYVFLSI